MLSSLFSFQGRITRRRLAVSCFGGLLAWGVAVDIFGSSWRLASLAFLWLFAAEFWKRAQDVGWLGVYGLIPGLNLIFFVIEGTNGPNAYGPDPRLSGQVKLRPPIAQPRPGSIVSPGQRAKDRPRESAQMRRFVCTSCGASNRQAAAPGAAVCDYCGGPN